MPLCCRQSSALKHSQQRRPQQAEQNKNKEQGNARCQTEGRLQRPSAMSASVTQVHAAKDAQVKRGPLANKPPIALTHTSTPPRCTAP